MKSAAATAAVSAAASSAPAALKSVTATLAFTGLPTANTDSVAFKTGLIKALATAFNQDPSTISIVKITTLYARRRRLAGNATGTAVTVAIITPATNIPAGQTATASILTSVVSSPTFLAAVATAAGVPQSSLSVTVSNVAVADVALPPPAAKTAAPSNVAAIGGAVGGVIVALLLGAFFIRRQRAGLLAQALAASPKSGDALGGDGSPVLRQNPMARGMVRTHSKKFVVSSLVPLGPGSGAPGGAFEAENPLQSAHARAERVEMPPIATGGGAVTGAASPADAAAPGAVEPGAAPPAPADPAAEAAAPSAEDDETADAKARARAAHDAGELPPKWDWDTADDGEI